MVPGCGSDCGTIDARNFRSLTDGKSFHTCVDHTCVLGLLIVGVGVCWVPFVLADDLVRALGFDGLTR